MCLATLLLKLWYYLASGHNATLADGRENRHARELGRVLSLTIDTRPVWNDCLQGAFTSRIKEVCNCYSSSDWHYLWQSQNISEASEGDGLSFCPLIFAFCYLFSVANWCYVYKKGMDGGDIYYSAFTPTVFSQEKDMEWTQIQLQAGRIFLLKLSWVWKPDSWPFMLQMCAYTAISSE